MTDNPPVVVFGATCQSGIELCRLLSVAGRPVVPVARANSQTEQLQELGLVPAIADAFDNKAIGRVFENTAQGATVVSFLGGGARAGKPVDAVGNINVIDAAVGANASRFVFVTTMGAGESFDFAPERAKQFLGRVMKLKTEAEDHLKRTSLDWTILRPGGLTIPAPTGQGILVEDPATLGPISRTDLGALTYGAIVSTRTINKAYTAVDSGHASNAEGRAVVPAET